MTPEEKLKKLGITLQLPPPPQGNYVPCVKSGNLLFLAGAICMVDGQMVHTGKVGINKSISEAQEAARLCALNLIGVMKSELGELSRVKQILSVTGFVNCLPDFIDQPQVINGASDLFVQVFGERGKHSRAAVGAVSLPKDTTVEVAAIIEFE